MEQDLTAAERQYVLFRLRGEEYGLPITAVQSIVRYEEPTPVPRAPEGVDGVFSLRGQVMALVDFGRRLAGEPMTPTFLSRVIVADTPLGPVGLAVDAVTEVANIPVADIREAPQAALSAEWVDAYEGVVTHGERLIMLLDPEKTLPKPVFAGGGAAKEEDGDV